MSQITVQTYGTLREKVGKRKISINAGNIKDAFEKLANQNLYYNPGDIISHVLLKNDHIHAL